MQMIGKVVRVGVVAAGMLAAAAPAARAQTFGGVLNSAQQVPPNSSPATGATTLTLGGVGLNQLTVFVSWQSLTSALVGGHIHCCTVGPAVGQNAVIAVPFPNLPGSTTGTYTNVFDLLSTSTYTADFLANFGGGTAAGARAALIAGMTQGRSYVNLHTTNFPGGEIRANIATVPEPGTYALMAAGLAGLGAAARRRRRA